MTDESKSVLLTIGRLPVALELARVFQANGWRVVVAEPLGWHVARLSNHVSRCFTVPSPVHDLDGWESRLLEIIDREAISLVVPVSEEIFYVADLKNRLGSEAQVLSMNHDVLLSLHDKWRFAELAMQLGLPVPETVLCDDKSVPSLMNRTAVVQKPRFGCAGVGVTRHERGTTLPIEQMDAFHVMQRCVSGAACCSFAIAVAGRIQTSVVYRPQVQAGSVAVCFEAVHAPEAVTRVVEAIITDKSFTGMIAFDHLWSETDGWQVIECNPRATSGLHLLPAGDVFEALVKAVDHLLNRDAHAQSLIGSPGTIDVSEVAEVAEVPELLDVPEVRDVPDGQASTGASGASHASHVSEVPRAAPGPSVHGQDLSALVSGEERLVSRGFRAQEFWSHLAELQGRLLRGRFQSRHWKRLFVTADICWSRDDPKPAVFFVPVNVRLMIRAWRAGVSIPQVVMQDIEWHPKRYQEGGEQSQ